MSMENKENHVCGVNCPSCGHGCAGNHLHTMKWVIKITVLVIIFCFAFKLGELKGMLESRGYGEYRNNTGAKMMYNGYGAEFQPGMMQNPINQ